MLCITDSLVVIILVVMSGFTGILLNRNEKREALPLSSRSEKYFFLLQCLSPVLTNRYRLDGILKTIYVIRPFRLYVGTRAEICIC